MAITNLLNIFESLKKTRRTTPESVLIKIGEAASEALADLTRSATSHPIGWEGSGPKSYKVFSIAPDQSSWSRAVNTDLFIEDVSTFNVKFEEFAENIIASRGRLIAQGLTAESIDAVMYTTVLSFATVAGLYNGGRGIGGTFFEMTVGAVLSLLTGRQETGDIILPIPDTGKREIVKVDLNFYDASGISLAVPTKISTRERISQAYVHARILETAYPGRYRNILCVANENNMFSYKDLPKDISSLYVQDTLVPGTIALYQRYVAEMSAMYYLDPPASYLTGERAGLPPVKRFSSLLLGDLPELLT